MHARYYPETDLAKHVNVLGARVGYVRLTTLVRLRLRSFLVRIQFNVTLFTFKRPTCFHFFSNSFITAMTSTSVEQLEKLVGQEYAAEPVSTLPSSTSSPQ